MEKTTVLKKVIAVFLLCVYCAMPLLAVAAPSFPNTLRVPQKTIDAYKCWSNPVWQKSGSPTQGRSEFYSTSLHKTQWSQKYACTRRGCCGGKYTYTQWDYSSHSKSRLVKTTYSSAGYATDTYYCAVCNHNFPVVRKIK